MTESEQSLSKYVRAVLDGFGQAWIDATGKSKPSDDQLIDLLPESDETNRLALAGYAYGVANKLSSEYPGAAILLLGAALDSIGSAPRSELREQVQRVRTLLKNESLTDDPDVAAVLNAAQTLSNFDKVTQKMKAEFAQGLKESGSYQENDIEELVEEIVNVTHAVRHKGLVQRFFISRRRSSRPSGTIYVFEHEDQQSSSNASFIDDADEYEIVEDRLSKLVSPAQTACAHQISRRLQNRMNDQTSQ
jgi:hypothetical protein